jgi:integrase
LLILTGQRELEIAHASWPEVDFDKQLMTIPAERMKGDRVHEVPLAPIAAELLQLLPRWTAPFIFTTTAGAKPINGFSKAKSRIDKLSGVTGWVIHDLRRTVRTHFSALPVQDLVRELVIAHAKPGLHRVYDQHAYQDEKRHCLELWERRLSSILGPVDGENVIALRARG